MDIKVLQTEVVSNFGTIILNPLIADDGILIIEDVQDITWLNKLNETVPEDLKKYIRNYDLRKIKRRYDDIVFTIDKSR